MFRLAAVLAAATLVAGCGAAPHGQPCGMSSAGTGDSPCYASVVFTMVKGT